MDQLNQITPANHNCLFAMKRRIKKNNNCATTSSSTTLILDDIIASKGRQPLGLVTFPLLRHLYLSHMPWFGVFKKRLHCVLKT